jgi:hypothetical protein
VNLVLSTVVAGQLYNNASLLMQYCAARFLPDWHVRIFSRDGGDAHNLRSAMEILGGSHPDLELVRGGAFPYYAWATDGNTRSATNMCRFLLGWNYFEDLDPDYVLMVDADLLLFQDPLAWHLVNMDPKGCFAGHHGPYRKPYRPEVSNKGWHGDFERVAGGFFLMSRQWFEQTKVAREKYCNLLYDGKLAPGWREMDEVILARIIKESGLTVPKNKRFPAELRGVHLGDFRDDMTHRWTNMEKMQSKLTNENCLNFRTLEADNVWQELLKVLSHDVPLMRILGNVRSHLSKRGM